jgi:hypothetical protein
VESQQVGATDCASRGQILRDFLVLVLEQGELRAQRGAVLDLHDGAESVLVVDASVELAEGRRAVAGL